MKRIIIICIAVATCFSCYYEYKRIPFALVHLHILKEDGTSFNDTEAERFILQYRQAANHQTKVVINTEDALIFQCSTEIQIYKKGNEITDDDIKRALEAGDIFAIKDKKGEYKTVKMAYKECYQRHEANPSPRRTYSDPDYIYHCEVRLQKK